jgi:YD repeat-containing protein
VPRNGHRPSGNQTGNNGDGTGKPLTITYLPTNQTQSISNTSQEPVTMAWTGPGQGERASRSWTDSGTTYTERFTYSPLGLAGRTTNTPNTPASSQFIRDPYGTPVAERNSDGTEYYYLFDGQGNVVGIEDPGTMVGSYDYCPTGNAVPLNGEQSTQAALNNPLRQGASVYDDNTKDYVGSTGVIKEDYSGVGTQTAALQNGDTPVETVASCEGGAASASSGPVSFAAEVTPACSRGQVIGAIGRTAGGIAVTLAGLSLGVYILSNPIGLLATVVLGPVAGALVIGGVGNFLQGVATLVQCYVPNGAFRG